ncbi:hypothetical protein D3C86_2133530 [compost metagenome]
MSDVLLNCNTLFFQVSLKNRPINFNIRSDHRDGFGFVTGFKPLAYLTDGVLDFSQHSRKTLHFDFLFGASDRFQLYLFLTLLSQI